MATVPLDPQIIVGPGIRVGNGIIIGANATRQRQDFITEQTLEMFVSESGTDNFITEQS